MLECLKFLLNLVIKFLSSLFRVNVGFTNLGVVFCIVYILFPIMLAIVNFIKTTFVEELDERYDESRPREYLTASKHTKKNGWDIYHSYKERRRLR